MKASKLRGTVAECRISRSQEKSGAENNGQDKKIVQGVQSGCLSAREGGKVRGKVVLGLNNHAS